MLSVTLLLYSLSAYSQVVQPQHYHPVVLRTAGKPHRLTPKSSKRAQPGRGYALTRIAHDHRREKAVAEFPPRNPPHRFNHELARHRVHHVFILFPLERAGGIEIGRA